jgi:drug/metabolite transporter (DMT)-like permease
MRKTWVYVKLTLTAIFWGGTFIAGRIVAAELPPFSAAFVRFALAAVLLVAIVWRTEGALPRPTARQAFRLAVLGMTGVFAYNAGFFAALKLIEASRASLIVALCPVLLSVSAAVFFRERFTILKALGVILSVSGAMLVISRGALFHLLDGGVGLGELLIFSSVVSWTIYSLVGRLVMGQLSPLVAVTWSVLVGLAALLPAAVCEGALPTLPQLPWRAWIGLLYLAAFGTVLGFVWYYEGIRRVGAVRAGLFINLVPVSAVLLSWLLLGERVTPSLLLGGALVVAGVSLTNRVAARDSGVRRNDA